MDRRAFLVGGGAMLVATPLGAEAQPAGKVVRIGFVEATGSSSGGHLLDAFRRELRDLGYVEGQNITIEARWAEGMAEGFRVPLAEFVALRVDVIVVGSGIGARAAKGATATIPIVFAGVSDPVGLGLVTNLARPGANVTGVSLAIGEQFSGKWVELVREAVPNATHIGVLVSSTNPASEAFSKAMSAAAQALGMNLRPFDGRDASHLARAFTAMTHERLDALIVTADPLFFTQRTLIVEFAAGRRLPTMFFFKELVAAGGLMSYGPSIAESFRRAASYVDRILKGTKPGDLPIEQPTKFELVINLKTARALGVTIPQSLLLRADQVLE